MKNFLVYLTFLATASLFAGCQSQGGTAEQNALQHEISAAPAELIINLTSDVNELPESSLMALNFAEKALENDIAVTVFMNVRGVKLASTAAADIVINQENLQQIIKRIINKGGNVVACPMCMQVQGIDESELMDGIKVSTPGFMMQKLKESPTVFTY